MKQVFSLFFIGLIMISCSKKSASEEPSAEADAFALERENFFNSLRHPDELATIVPGITSFDAGILNGPEHYNRYMDNSIKAAANLGVYISDLNYCILLNQREETKKYFQATYELSKAIQIEKSILTFLMIRYERNLGQNDSVKAVVNQLFSQSTLGLQGSDRERLAGIAMAGYQLENLHLALTTLDSFPDVLTEEQTKAQKQLFQFIVEQSGKIDVIYNFIRANSDPSDPEKNPNYPFFDNALRELIMVYRNVSESDPRLDELKDKISVLRNKVVNL